jgi:hypothetical protein
MENGEDGLQIKKLSNWKISKYGKWWRWVVNSVKKLTVKFKGEGEL